MSKVFIEETTLSAIGDAIREKGGTTTLIAPLDMATAIRAIETGGTPAGIPENAFRNLINNGYRYYNNNWNWFIEDYGSQMKEPLEVADFMFAKSHLLKEIPFTLCFYDADMNSAFYGCQYLEEINDYEVPPPYQGDFGCGNLFEGCIRLRTLPYDLFGTEIYDGDPYPPSSTTYGTTITKRGSMFYGCYSLRELPNLKTMITQQTTISSTLYYRLVASCYTLNEVVNLPVTQATLFTNAFGTTFLNTSRLKNLTFEPNTKANWRNQTIDCTTYVGWASYDNHITDYNSGIVGKKITNWSSYSLYKNDPDSWTTDVAYSRYNKTSALATIASLPDTSEYLASAGGTNTIAFKGEAGRLTDGGAIDTLTEEVIAVATAKGWTVSFT